MKKDEKEVCLKKRLYFPAVTHTRFDRVPASLNFGKKTELIAMYRRPLVGYYCCNYLHILSWFVSK